MKHSHSQLAIVNATVFTGSAVMHNAAIAIEDGKIRSINHAHGAGKRGETLDAGGRLVMPGFVNAHHHAYSALSTGMPAKPSSTFYAVLENLWWKLDRALTLDDVRLSARWTAAQCLRNGVTTVLDHHASYGAVRGSLSVICEEFDRAGIRGAVCFEVSDRNGPEATTAAIEENAAFVETAGVKRLFGLHAAFTISDETFRAVKRAAPPELGFHLHCAEDAIDIRDNHNALVTRLERFEVLRPATLLVHGVHLREDDLRGIAPHACCLVHCPDSNLHNGVGALDVARAQRLGVTVAAGTDGMHSSMLRTYKTAYDVARHVHRCPGAGCVETKKMYAATQALGARFFDDHAAGLKPGCRADMAIIDYQPHTPLTEENAWSHVLYGAAECPVYATICNGRIAFIDGTLKTMDEASLTASCTSAAQALWKRMR